nr:chloride intracellular channel protein 2 [Aotus nancymaae]
MSGLRPSTRVDPEIELFVKATLPYRISKCRPEGDPVPLTLYQESPHRGSSKTATLATRVVLVTRGAPLLGISWSVSNKNLSEKIEIGRRQNDIGVYIVSALPTDLSLLIFNHRRKPEALKDLAPGTNPPFLVYNKELKTDFIKIEEFLEQTLAPPRYSIFKILLKEFKRLDDYLNTPLLDEMDPDSPEEPTVSRRLFLDGNQLTLADCSLLPKLNVIKVAAKKYRNFDIPAEFSGVWRYLHNAYAREEFTHTCPEDKEIENTYANVAKQNS